MKNPNNMSLGNINGIQQGIISQKPLKTNIKAISSYIIMIKKKKISQEEKAAEEYFPVEEDDLKRTTQKEVKEQISKEEFMKRSIEIPVKEFNQGKEILRGSIEKTYKKPDRKELEKVEYIIPIKKEKAKKKTARKSTKTRTNNKSLKADTFSPPEMSLKKDGYELVITEKPQAAAKIANALGKAKTKFLPNKTNYYELERKGKKIVVACAVGHLFTLSQKNSGSQVPVFDIGWIPNYLVRKSDFSKKYYDTLKNLVKNAGSITVATDYDIEGEVIGLNIVRFIAGQQDANRMKFSTLTPSELNQAYENKSSKIDWGQAIAGETRHYLDWFYGINLSRALMNSIKAAGSFKIMSIGRVQGPALNLIAKKEKQIQAFKSQPYWQVFITIQNKENKLELKYIRDIFKKEELKKFKNLIGKTAIAETKKTQQKLPPNPPFNLTTLQTEAYRLYGITPSKTLQIAQSLYLSGLISYPRTSSQKLPPSIAYNDILKKLAKKYRVEHLIKKEKPVEGKSSDPAHPSIYPTGQEQILSGQDEKIYNLIVKRFLCLFCEDAIIDNKTIRAEVDGLDFFTKGSQVEKMAWLEIYPTKIKETEIPDMNGEVKIINSKTEEKETQPPKRYSPASIITELEKRAIGTKSTRSSIIETLYERGYIKDTSIQATPLGISLIESLEKYSPIIIDEELTRKFEKEMNSIQESKSNLDKKEERVIEEAKEAITKIAKDFEKNEEKIGKELVQATKDLREQEKKQNIIMQCHKCQKGNLAIMYSPKTKRHFVACDSYPECKTTFSLPPNGLIKKTDKLCQECNFPMLMRLSKGKKPWVFCFNPECKTNKERIEEYRNKKEQENSG